MLVGDRQLEAGQVRAEPEVLAHAEPKVMVRRAVDLELVRILEDLLVAVGRRIEERDRLAA